MHHDKILFGEIKIFNRKLINVINLVRTCCDRIRTGVNCIVRGVKIALSSAGHIKAARAGLRAFSNHNAVIYVNSSVRAGHRQCRWHLSARNGQKLPRSAGAKPLHGDTSSQWGNSDRVSIVQYTIVADRQLNGSVLSSNCNRPDYDGCRVRPVVLSAYGDEPTAAVLQTVNGYFSEKCLFNNVGREFTYR